MKRIIALAAVVIIIIAAALLCPPAATEEPPATTGAEFGDWTYKTINGNTEIEITKYNGNDANVVVPSTIDGKPVTRLADGSSTDNLFRGTSEQPNTWLKSVVLPNGLKHIGRYAFYYCTSLTSIVIPDGVTSIGYSAFQGCTSLTDITFLGSPPTVGSNWLTNVPSTARGHALPGSGFPEPGETWNGLVMGEYYRPPLKFTSKPSVSNIVTTIDGRTVTASVVADNYTSIVWDMGDGTIYEGVTQVRHEYADDGTHVITVTVLGGLGQGDATVTAVQIGDTVPVMSINGAGMAVIAAAGSFVLALGAIARRPVVLLIGIAAIIIAALLALGAL